jgi:hypothetical protein
MQETNITCKEKTPVVTIKAKISSFMAVCGGGGACVLTQPQHSLQLGQIFRCTRYHLILFIRHQIEFPAPLMYIPEDGCSRFFLNVDNNIQEKRVS